MHAPSAPDTSTTGRHVPALDGLRGIAILLVLARHLLWSNATASSSRFINVVFSVHAAGWVGVDLFFVLSGFLITGILYDTLHTEHFFRDFYARRALRIFPLYYGFLLLVLALGAATGAQPNRGMLYYFTYTDNLFIFPAVMHASWANLYHCWSLAVEEQFYLVWPLLVFLLRTRKRIALFAGLGALASLAWRVSLWHTQAATNNPYLLYSWTPVRLDGLLTGAVLAILVRSEAAQRFLRFRYWVFWAGFLALLACDVRFPGLPAQEVLGLSVWLPALLALTFAALVAIAFLSKGVGRRLLSHPVLRFYGRLSYGLYLLHPPVVDLIEMPLRLALRSTTHSRALAVLLEAATALLLSTAIAWLSFRFYELPWLRLKRYFSSQPVAPTLQAYRTADQLAVEARLSSTTSSGV